MLTYFLFILSNAIAFSGLVVVFGALAIGMAYVASQLGEVLEAALSIQGMVGGPLVAIFTLAILFPFANSFVSTTSYIRMVFKV